MDARREAEALSCLLKAVLLPAVSGDLVLHALFCVFSSFFLKGPNMELTEIT